jgi:acyl carrier protein
LSDVLRREAIDRVGLLKIDVQRAELGVLAGIDDGDWPRIDQVVVEVHDRVGDEVGRVGRVVSLLERHGLSATVEQDELLRGTDRYNVYAVRERAAAAAPDEPELAIDTASPVSPLSVDELRTFVAERLPQHMVPAAIAVLAQLPLTPNGKVDRAALPDPAAPTPTKAKILPRTDLERELAEVWREVLPLQEIAVEDDFFSLGGHSLRAMQLITRLRRRFLVELSLREFLSSPTIAGLAVVIAQKRAQQFTADEVARVLEEMEKESQGAVPAPASWMAAAQENGPDGEPIDRHVEQKGGST